MCAIALLSVALVSAVTPARAVEVPKEPYFLVATRSLPDPLFQQSVILMLPRTRLPLVAGLIINKPTTITVRKLFPEAKGLKSRDEPAYFGGPVDPMEASVVVRSSEAPENTERLLDDTYLSIDPGSIAALLGGAQSAKDARVFLGRAQWTPEQLQAEIIEGSWYIVPAKVDLLFSSEPGRLWRTLVERAQLQEVEAESPP